MVLLKEVFWPFGGFLDVIPFPRVDMIQFHDRFQFHIHNMANLEE